MPRGGKREKAGRKSTWASDCSFEDTKLIRVPKAIADKVLDAAHKIDSGELLEPKPDQPTPVHGKAVPEVEQLSFLGEGQSRLVEIPLAIESPVIKYIEKLKTSLESKKTPSNRFGLFCPQCHSDDICKHGFNGSGKNKKQVYKCKTCGRRFAP